MSRKRPDPYKRALVRIRQMLRRAVADYMASEGCSCCRDRKSHEKHEAALAKLLRVPMYADKSGYDFGRFATPPASAGPEENQ